MLDEIDKRLMDLIQEGFPVVERPYEELGRGVGIGEKEAIARIRRLKEKGYIRRIGPVIDGKKVGILTILCATSVKANAMSELVGTINRHKGVTHNYEREEYNKCGSEGVGYAKGRSKMAVHDDGGPEQAEALNLWFTISGKDISELEGFLNTLEERFLIKIYRFPEKRVFKIRAYFPVQVEQ